MIHVICRGADTGAVSLLKGLGTGEKGQKYPRIFDSWSERAGIMESVGTIGERHVTLCIVWATAPLTEIVAKHRIQVWQSVFVQTIFHAPRQDANGARTNWRPKPFDMVSDATDIEGVVGLARMVRVNRLTVDDAEKRGINTRAIVSQLVADFIIRADRVPVHEEVRSALGALDTALRARRQSNIEALRANRPIAEHLDIDE